MRIFLPICYLLYHILILYSILYVKLYLPIIFNADSLSYLLLFSSISNKSNNFILNFWIKLLLLFLFSIILFVIFLYESDIFIIKRIFLVFYSFFSFYFLPFFFLDFWKINISFKFFFYFGYI